MPKNPTPAEAAVALSVSINDLNKRIDTLKKEQKTERRWRIALICALVFDFVITPVLGVVAVKAFQSASNATVTAAASQAAIHATCGSNNEFRAENKALWLYTINTLLPASSLTPAEQAIINKEKATIDKTFSPRNCSLPDPPKR